MPANLSSYIKNTTKNSLSSLSAVLFSVVVISGVLKANHSQKEPRDLISRGNAVRGWAGLPLSLREYCFVNTALVKAR